MQLRGRAASIDTELADLEDSHQEALTRHRSTIATKQKALEEAIHEAAGPLLELKATEERAIQKLEEEIEEMR